MEKKLVLFTNPLSRGRIAKWMLEELEVNYEQVSLSYDGAMKTKDFLDLNPMGKVPVLLHGDEVVTECGAICAYLADFFPDKGLSPRTNAERSRYYRWMYFAAGPLEAALTNETLGFTIPDDKTSMCGYGNYKTMLSALECAVTTARFIAGDRFTAADVYVGSQIIWGMHYKILPKLESFLSYTAALMARQGYKRSLA